MSVSDHHRDARSESTRESGRTGHQDDEDSLRQGGHASDTVGLSRISRPAMPRSGRAIDGAAAADLCDRPLTRVVRREAYL